MLRQQAIQASEILTTIHRPAVAPLTRLCRALIPVLLEPALEGAKADLENGGDFILRVIAGLIGDKRPFPDFGR